MTTVTKHQSQNESLHARIPQEILGDLDRIAATIGRSRNWVFNEAIKQYLHTQQWQLDLIQDRLSEAEKKDSSFFLHDDMMKRTEKRLKKKLSL